MKKLLGKTSFMLANRIRKLPDAFSCSFRYKAYQSLMALSYKYCPEDWTSIQQRKGDDD